MSQGIRVSAVLRGIVVLLALWIRTASSQACQFYPLGENRRFERVAENLPLGREVFRVEVHPRREFKLEAVDNSLSDINYFKHEELDDRTVAIKLAHSLEDLVDQREPQSVLKFKLTCKGAAGTEEAFLPVTVYVQDVNDHSPEFQNVPYHLEVDELTPVGLTVFRGIHAIDRDKPNTANSDITYSIVGGNENNSFILSDPIEGILVVNKPLDYDHGIREFKLKIQASDHGTPESLSSVTTMTITVRDADDQNPIFTQDIYKANVSETPQITGNRIRQKVVIDPPIHAFDQDTGINARLRYSIILGNEAGFFEMHEQTGELFLVKEIDLESLSSSIIALQISASQVDNLLRQALARVDIRVLDVNDNSPEFEYDMYNITVIENLQAGFTVLQVFAQDKDMGENAQFKYVLDDPSGAFRIDEKTGWISVRDPTKLDRETKDVLFMKVRAVEKNENVNPAKQSSSTMVEIHLLDANDNNPRFIPSNVYSFSVLETDGAGTILGSVFAIDPDLGDNGKVLYHRQNDTLSRQVPFDVYHFNGSIYVLDAFVKTRVKPDYYTFFVTATDLAAIHYERRSAVAVVRINVTDINNSVPEFIGAPYEALVGESLPAGAHVIQISATDADSNTVLEYSIVAGNDQEYFKIDRNTGRIETATVLDYEKRQSYDLLVQASDGINTAVAPLLVKVVDINDQAPIFRQPYYNFSVVEEIQENVTAGTVMAEDHDSGRNAIVRYSIVGDRANEAFYIDDGGNIWTRKRLDRETEPSLEFLVIAFDGGIPQLSGTATVNIKVEDINDNPPSFDSDTYAVTVPEEESPPYEVFRLQAKDNDEGDNAVIKYLILAGNEDKMFGIEEDTGRLFTTEKLDYEKKQEYLLHVAARNLRPFQGPNASTISNPAVQLIIKVRDINDELVVFDRQGYSFRIFENVTRSETVGFLNATNLRRPPNEQDIIYWIGDGNKQGKFWVNPRSGELVLMDTVDRDPPENQHSFKLRVYARDLLSSNPFNTSVPVVIDVLDVNDNSPVFDEEKYVLELPESLPTGTTLPPFFKARDIDAGPNGKIQRYYLEGAKGVFSVNNKTGAISLVSTLDYETLDKHEFSVFVADGGDPPRTGSAMVVIQVQNINEFSPKFVGLPYEFWVHENAGEGTSVGQVKASDGDGNNIKYSISDGDVDFFTIEEDTGRIFVRKSLASRTQYTFIARATDDGLPQNYSLGVQVTVHVNEANDHPPVFDEATYHGKVVEKVDTDRVIVKVTAIDKDLQNNTVTYSILSGNEDGIFQIDPYSGEIKVIPGQGPNLDYDRKKSYIILIQATDSHKSPLYGLAMVTIDVQDTNDHPPVFSKTAYSASLAENLPSGHCFLQVQADSRDSVDAVAYALANKDVPFSINPRTGDICTKTVLDREKRDRYEFAAVASDGKFEVMAPVTVDVMDDNDNPPRFERERYIVSIPYDSPPGRSVLHVHATDPDVANNGEITYWIKNTHGMFEIDPKTGLVRLVTRLSADTQQNATYEMEVFAQDHGVTPNIGKAVLVVRASNTKNHPPRFERFSYYVTVDENAANIPLLTVHAFDPDSGKAGRVLYRIVKATKSEAFRIERDTGKITLMSPLDYEQIKHLELIVEARDEAREPQFATTVVQVSVNDVNDNAPEFLSVPRILRVPQTTSQNEVIYTVQAIDLDSAAGGNNMITYEIVPPSSFFAINIRSGEIFATQGLLPVTETLHIVATDGAVYPLSSATDMTIEVYKESSEDPTPIFTSAQYTIQSDNALEAGATVINVRATIPNGSPVWYNITSSDGGHLKRFSIDHMTGRVTTTSRLDPEHMPVYHFLVTAHNRKDQSRYAEAGVVLRLLDNNSRCPKFPFSEYYAAIKENSLPDSIVVPSLMVEEAEKFGQLSYQITEDNSNDNFYVDMRTSNISLKVKKLLDRDSMPRFLQGIFTLTITASNQRCSSSTRAKILVEDVNDNNPLFEKTDFVVELKENTPIGHVVSHLSATDKDEIDGDKLRYYITEGNEEEAFLIEEKTGILSVRIVPDRERSPAYMLRVVAVDSANNTGWTSVHIIILDENDWTPTFLNETFILNITEGPGSVGAHIRLPVVDYDEGVNRQMEVYIADGNSNGEFRLQVDKHGPVLSVVSELDREKYGVQDAAKHNVIVAAKDRGTPSRTGTATVMVLIQDINDTPPKFEKDGYYEFISENTPLGVVVTTVKATDEDADYNTNITYSFARKNRDVPFAIDPYTGVVNVSRPLDISESQQYIITVEAFDGVWKAKTTLNVYVSEAEERDPRFDQVHYRFSVPENEAGALVGRVELKPRQLRTNSQMRYTIVNAEMREFFNITAEGEIFTRRGLDREKRSRYAFTVMLEERRPSVKVSVSEVTVEVTDVNDEIPTFHQSYEGTIRENSLPGTSVKIIPPISAVDNDSGNNSVVRYSLHGLGSDRFTILDSGTVIYTPTDRSQNLDREEKDKYNLQVTATDLGNLSSSTNLIITIEDENDNAPVFQHGPLFVLLPEIARPGSKIVEVKATDADAKGPNSKIQYKIISGAKGDIRIDRITGEIFVVGTLDPGAVYLLNVSAVDGQGLSAYTRVNVTIVDVNDHRPTFDRPVYRFEVDEGNYTKDRHKLGVLRARDEDIGKNGLVEYIILHNVDAQFPFYIDVHTGELFAKGLIDRESIASYKFEVMALDNGEPPLNSTANVTVKVLDVNDERPRFYTDPYLAHVPENLDPGVKVTQIAAFDPDLGENGQVFYKLGDGHQNKFYIDGKDGTVWTLSTLDYEQQAFYNMTVIAYDKGVPSLSATAKLWITVADTNDAIPEFSKSVYTLEVAENTKPGEIVYTLSAGEEGKFHYSLINEDDSDTFAIESSTGEIRLLKSLDSNQKNHYRLLAKAEDKSDPPKSDTAEVNVIVGTGQGVRLFPQRMYEVTVFENQLAPQVIIDLNATDEIAHRPVEYSIVGPDFNGLFIVEPESGRVSVTASLDRERKANYSLKVKADNKNSRRYGRDVSRNLKGSINIADYYHLAFDETLVVVQVGDENDNSPVFDNEGRPVVAAVPLEATFGYQITKVTARDADTGFNGAIRYEIVAKAEDSSSKFHIDPVTGVIRSVVTFSLDGGKQYAFDVKATDREGSESGNSAYTSVFVYVLPETRLVLLVADTEPLFIEQHAEEILGYLSKVTRYDVKMAKLEPHHEAGVEDHQSTDLFLYAVSPESNEIVDTDTLLGVFSENSLSITEYLQNYKVRRIQGVTVQEKISQMGATEIAIIALSSVIFLGAVLGIVLLCSSCKERKLRKRQTTWEQQRLYNIKNPLMGKTVGNPYGGRLPNGNSVHMNSGYASGDGAGSEYVDSLMEVSSFKRNNRRRQQMPPDGASSLNPPRSPRFDRYNKNDIGWYDPKDGAESVASGVSKRSDFTSWSSPKSRTSRGSPSTQL